MKLNILRNRLATLDGEVESLAERVNELKRPIFDFTENVQHSIIWALTSSMIVVTICYTVIIVSR